MSLIGRDITTNKDIEIEQGHRCSGMLILGRTGSGKSTIIEQLCVQDIRDGLGCCVIEPSGKLINNILVRVPPEREKDVILLWPEDEEQAFGLNIYDCPSLQSPRMISYTLNNVMDTFEKLYDMSRSTPRMAQVMRNIALTMIYNPGMTLIDVLPLLEDKAFRDRLLIHAQPEQMRFWQRYDKMRFSEQMELTGSTQNKMDEFVNDPLLKYIFGQSKTSINFRDVMDSKKLLFIHLSSELPAMTDLLGCICVGQILAAAVTRNPDRKYPQFNLYIDELQRFLTPALNTLLTEARKYSIATCAAHQVRDQLDDVQKATTLQAQSLIVFSVTSKDAAELAPEFSTAPPEAIKPPGTTPADILNSLTDHPDEEVKVFWTIFVKKLLDAKNMPPRTPLREYFNILEEKPYPYFLIDGKKVYFDAEIGRELLEPLQQLFYNSSINRGGNEAILRRALLLALDAVEGNEPLFNRDKYFNFFADSLKQALYHVYLKPIETTTTEWHETLTTQQTYSDRAAQIANELTQLDVGQARVRVPKWDKEKKSIVMVEHTIRTIPPYTDKNLLTPENIRLTRQKYLEQTRRLYCKPRAEIEEEIRKRQQPPNQSTTRTHPI